MESYYQSLRQWRCGRLYQSLYNQTTIQLDIHCDIYIDTQSRDAQNSTQMYEFIMNIIDEADKRRIVYESEKNTTS